MPLPQCSRDPCSGEIEDGFCNRCGLAPANTSTTLVADPQRISAIDPLVNVVSSIVPDHRRRCGNCDTKLNRDAGFCPSCRQQYSFVPLLTPGDIVAGKYQVKGTIAFGAMGWIYLAFYQVLSRWVALKGLLNTQDEKMLELAVREREFLAQVRHPSIVSIYDFVTHGQQGFIVMEYVHGKTLATLRKENEKPLAVQDALAYIRDVLPAFVYLAQQELVYCDFKPENAIVCGQSVRLIDLGAARKINDTSGDIYGTRGYCAPEANQHPTPQSDLYSIGRTLAVLVADFDFLSQYENSLPSADEIDVFRKHPALYRLIARATHANPQQRMASAEEFSEQIEGVFQSVQTVQPVQTHRESLRLFVSQRFASVKNHSAPHKSNSRFDHGLPRVIVPSPERIRPVLYSVEMLSDHERRLAELERLHRIEPQELAITVRLVEEWITLGRIEQSEQGMQTLKTTSTPGWIVHWLEGRIELVRGDLERAHERFDQVFSMLPGESAPRLALGFIEHIRSQHNDAIGHLDAAVNIDPSNDVAWFLLGQSLVSVGQLTEARRALAHVRIGDRYFTDARLALVRLHLLDQQAQSIIDAAESLEPLLTAAPDLIDVYILQAEVLLSAVAWLEQKKLGLPRRLLGFTAEIRTLRLAAEQAYRNCARLSAKTDERIEWVEKANQVRPFTLW